MTTPALALAAASAAALAVLLRAIGDALARTYRIAASEWPLERVRRWYDAGIPLCAYLSDDGALMLADPTLGCPAAPMSSASALTSSAATRTPLS